MSASVDLGEVADAGSTLSFRFTIDNSGTEELEVFASPRDGRRKGVFFLLSMAQVNELGKIIEKAKSAGNELRTQHQRQTEASYRRPERIIEATLIEDSESEARVLYNSAKKCLASGNRTATIALLREVISQFPDSTYAKKARKSLNKPKGTQ